MSGAAAAASTLREALRMADRAMDLRASVDAYKRALRDLLGASDLDDAMPASARLILAAEGLRDGAKGMAEAGRRWLGETMGDVSAPAFRVMDLTVSVGAPRASVQITDLAALPPQFMRHPPPSPDKDAIAAAIKAGESVPGAMLRNGSPTLLFRGRKS